MVSLAELKTGKEKLELINQILLRIDTIARALDNTRLDEIVGLKESVNSLHEQTLELKQEVLTMYTSFSENKKDFDTKFSSVNEKFSIMQERFSFIEQAYNDFSSSKEELELIKGFIEENKPVFESLKDDLSKYESMKIDLEAIITEATNNTKLSKEYFELSSKIKDDILRELEHCKDLVQELNYSADELRGLKPELLQIKKEVNELSSQASKVVLDASEIIKNKINTIFFENQRLNQEMIDSVKKLEEIKYDVGIKYKEIIQAYNLLLETKESLEELKEVIALYKEFENDIKSYSELIKNFKEQIANLESDLENKAQGLHEALEAKGEQVISSIETAKNEAIVKFDELVAKCEGYKIYFEQSYDRFNQRALIANEDLGRLAEVAKKELGNDKLIYETELKALRDEILQEMNEVSDKVINDSTGVIASIDEKANELKDFIDISRVNIDNLINAFNANYNQKIQEITSLNTNALSSIEEAKTSSLSDINTSKDESLSSIETSKDNALSSIEEAKTSSLSDINTSKDESLSSIETSKDNALSSIEEAKTQGISLIDEKIMQIDFNGIKERVEKNEGNIASIEESLENKAKLLMQNLSWTVSSETESDTNFNTLQKALDEASKYTPVTNSKITIKLKTGFILSEEIRIQDRNIGFITIISETETKYDVDKLSGKTIFYFDNSRTPYLLIKLSPNKADNGRTFIVGSRTSIGSIGGTFTNCPNVFFWDNGILSIRGIQVINATQSIGSSACSIINAAGSSSNENYTVFKNCTKALFSSASSDLYLESAKFENCVLNGEGPGFYFHRGGRALMINTKFINCKHTVSITAFFQFNLGGMVQISNTSFNSIDPTNRCNIATNQTTPNGVFLVS